MKCCRRCPLTLYTHPPPPYSVHPTPLLAAVCVLVALFIYAWHMGHIAWRHPLCSFWALISNCFCLAFSPPLPLPLSISLSCALPAALFDLRLPKRFFLFSFLAVSVWFVSIFPLPFFSPRCLTAIALLTKTLLWCQTLTGDTLVHNSCAYPRTVTPPPWLLPKLRGSCASFDWWHNLTLHSKWNS